MGLRSFMGGNERKTLPNNFYVPMVIITSGARREDLRYSNCFLLDLDFILSLRRAYSAI